MGVTISQHENAASDAYLDASQVNDAQVDGPQKVAREALLSMITAQTQAIVPDVAGGVRAHEVALTLVQLAAAYAAIVGSENQ